MKRMLLLALGAMLLPFLARAETGRCVLEVNHKTFLKGPCEITTEDDQGSFAIGVGKARRAPYFAYVTMEDDGARGYWNETPNATHAHTSLGILKHDGACWTNNTARVCAYK